MGSKHSWGVKTCVRCQQSRSTEDFGFLKNSNGTYRKDPFCPDCREDIEWSKSLKRCSRCKQQYPQELYVEKKTLCPDCSGEGDDLRSEEESGAGYIKLLEENLKKRNYNHEENLNGVSTWRAEHRCFTGRD